MQVLPRVSRIFAISKSRVLIHSTLLVSLDAPVQVDSRVTRHQCGNCGSFSSRNLHFRGSFDHHCTKRLNDWLLVPKNPVILASSRQSSATATEKDVVKKGPTEAVKEFYDKMVQSVHARTMPPNAWLWSLLENCSNRNDIELLFEILHTLRRFRLSNLRIHTNFNCNLCREIARACVRAGAIDFGKKTLMNHNVYGLTPSIASAHFLLLHAKKNNNTKLMAEIMKLIERNGLPLQPGTADIVVSICYNADDWYLLSLYSNKFLMKGVKLRQTTIDTWMQFAVNKGHIERLWKIEKLRSDTMKHHTLASVFSCSKGHLLENKPENAASLIIQLNQNMSDARKPDLMIELEKLVNKWPIDVMKLLKIRGVEISAAALENNITAMILILSEVGLRVDVATKEVTSMLSW